MKKELITAEPRFLIYTNQDGSIQIETKLLDETIWLSQKQLAELYQTTVANVNIHIRNILTEGELEPGSVIKEFLITASDGKSYHTMHYNLDYESWHQEQLAQPTAAEKHFVEALQEVKQISQGNKPKRKK